MLGLLTHMEQEYTFHSEREAGKGRADVLIVPKAPDRAGIILELKQTRDREALEEVARQAVEQIEEKQYITAFAKSDCSSVLAIGIAFAGKELATSHKMLG